MIPTWRKIYIAEYKVDMRKSFDGLLAEARARGVELWSGEAVIFVGQQKRIIKVLSADDTGIELFAKKFTNQGVRTRLRFLDDPSVKVVTKAELEMIWEGKDYEIKKVPVGWRPSPLPAFSKRHVE